MIADEFDAFLNGVFTGTLGGSDVLIEAVGDALKQAAAAAGVAAATAVIALV